MDHCQTDYIAKLEKNVIQGLGRPFSRGKKLPEKNKDPIKILKVGKMMNPSNPLAMRIIILFALEDGNLLMFH